MFLKKKFTIFFLREMGTFCLYLPFFSVFGLFLLQKLFQYWADPDVFRNHNPKFSGAPENPEESFFRKQIT